MKKLKMNCTNPGRISSVLTVCIFSLLINLSTVYATGRITDQLTRNSHDDLYPKISGDNIVWQGWDGSDSEIFLYDGSTIIQLTNNAYDDVNPKISGRNIVWRGYSGSDSEIFFYDGSTITQLTSNAFEDSLPQISGNNVVWQGYDGNDVEIYFFDGTLPFQQITNNDYDDLSPQISGKNIVWEGYGEPDVEIFLYTDSAISQLTDNAIEDNDPQISGDNIVWFSHFINGNYYYDNVLLYNSSTGNRTISRYTSPFVPTELADLHISGDNVIWTYTTDNLKYATRNIALYDGSAIIKLTNNHFVTFNQFNPQISENSVVWSNIVIDDYWNGVGDTEIFYYDGSRTIQLTYNTNDDLYPHISGENIVWQGWDGSDFEIYLYGFAEFPWILFSPAVIN